MYRSLELNSISHTPSPHFFSDLMVSLLTPGQCCDSIGLAHAVLRFTHVAAVELPNLRSGAKSIDKRRHAYTRVLLNQSINQSVSHSFYLFTYIFTAIVQEQLRSCCHYASPGVGTAQSVQRLSTGWTVRRSNPGGREIFRTRPDRPWAPPSLLYNGYRVFPGGKAAEAWR